MQTAPVGSFKPNRFGLHDMHGNVWQWVQDCYHDKYQGAPTDGSGWVTSCTDADRRVLRGGSWRISPLILRSADRGGYSTVSRTDYNGFRLGRTLNP
jgi:eukaryotic-like serine/threonine-protein kinase